MEASELKAYRQMGLDRLEQLLVQLPEEVSEADNFVDTSIRTLSGLPDRPEGAPPYQGLYGAGQTLDQYREVATDRLEELIEELPQLDKLDEEVDRYVRILSNLPERPADREPYTGLFVLRASRSMDPMETHDSDLASSKQYLTSEQLLRIAGTSQLKTRIEQLTPGVNATFEKFQINTHLRMAHFLAQVMHESGGFRWLREIWGPTAAQRGYEGRRDLGNTQPGDGKRFMGRGLIQLTGRNNYQKFSNDIGVDFVSNPELVERSPYAVLVAGWFWHSRGLNALADQDNLRQITRRINGGYNGLSDRERYLKRAKMALS